MMLHHWQRTLLQLPAEHTTQYVRPLSSTHVPQSLPSGCRLHVQLSARATELARIKAPASTGIHFMIFIEPPLDKTGMSCNRR
jgi:hypothetical protein